MYFPSNVIVQKHLTDIAGQATPVCLRPAIWARWSMALPGRQGHWLQSCSLRRGLTLESFFSAPVYAVPKASPYYVDEMFSSVIGVVTSPLKLCDLQACSSQAETKRQICMSTK